MALHKTDGAGVCQNFNLAINTISNVRNTTGDAFILHTLVAQSIYYWATGQNVPPLS